MHFAAKAKKKKSAPFTHQAQQGKDIGNSRRGKVLPISKFLFSTKYILLYKLSAESCEEMQIHWQVKIVSMTEGKADRVDE